METFSRSRGKLEGKLTSFAIHSQTGCFLGLTGGAMLALRLITPDPTRTFCAAAIAPGLRSACLLCECDKPVLEIARLLRSPGFATGVSNHSRTISSSLTRPRPSGSTSGTAPSHRSCDLLLKATCGVAIAVVSSRERKRRQPRLATDDPAFVGWHQLVRGIQGS